MKVIVIYSGGLDSYTLLRDAVIHHGADNVTAISFDYGQRHKKELALAVKVCIKLGVVWRFFDLSGLSALLPGSALTDSDVDVPEGHYEAESMKATVVPNRNLIMISIASAHALAVGATEVLLGAHAGDHAIYPDCRPQFLDAAERVIALGNYPPYPNLRAPYIVYTKGQILERAKLLGLTADDYADTWTCYKGREKACGKCGSCQERLEAFASVGWTDPIQYETTGEQK
jgi:7-cyano-7-deazaguanine synthase